MTSTGGRLAANVRIEHFPSVPRDVCRFLRKEDMSDQRTYPAFDKCPRCDGPLQDGFAQKAAGLSFVAPKSFEQFISLDEDLAEAGLRKLLPSKAEYFGSHVCRSCELYLIDFSRTYDRSKAKELLERIAKQ